MNKSTPQSRPFLAIVFFLLLAAMATLSACRLQQSDAAFAKKGEGGYLLLDLIGYNYTDRDIDSYSVNGQGGGNVRLSSPTSGGSGIVCCVKLSKDALEPIQVHVRWQVDGCTYVTKSEISGETDENIYSFYKESEVNVSRAAGVKPRHLEAHFYPDGSVQVQITEHLSPPRLSMDERRVDKSSFPRCKDDKRPE